MEVALYLIPVTLGDTAIEKVLPAHNKEIILGIENNPEIPPSSRDEGLRLLHGLETNLATSLQTPQEA